MMCSSTECIFVYNLPLYEINCQLSLPALKDVLQIHAPVLQTFLIISLYVGQLYFEKYF